MLTHSFSHFWINQNAAPEFPSCSSRSIQGKQKVTELIINAEHVHEKTIKTLFGKHWWRVDFQKETLSLDIIFNDDNRFSNLVFILP